MRLGKNFAIILLLKIEPSLRAQSFAAAESFRKDENLRKAGVTCEKTFYILGKYDIGAILTGLDLGAVSRLSYLIVQQIEKRCRGAVRDFTRIPAFRWAVPSRPLGEKPIVGLVQIKLSCPLMSFRDKGFTLIEAIARVRTYSFSLFGGLAWYEVILSLGGGSFNTIPKFLEKVVDVAPNKKLIGEISTIPAWEPHRQYSDFDMELSVSLKFHDFEKYGTIRQNLPGASPSLGFVDLQTNHRVFSISDVDNFLAKTEDRNSNIGVRRYSSNLIFSTKLLPKGKPSQPQTTKPDFVGQMPTHTARVDTDFSRLASTLHERIDAVKSQIQVLRNDPRFRYLIPPGLLQTLENLEFDSPFYSPSDVSGYISTLRHVIHQRLAGTYPTAATGIVTGYADGYGGYQRIILAAEALLARSLRIMLGGIFRIPPMLVLFDQRGLHQYDFNIYEAVRKATKGAPLIVRLQALKYEPWYWHRGIRDIALWCVELERFVKREVSGAAFLDFALSKPGDFATRMLNRRLYIRLRAFEAETPLATRTETGEFLLRRGVYESLRKDVAGCHDITKDSEYSSKKVSEISEGLMDGEIFSEELREDFAFRHFVNAYYSLPREDRKLPRVATAFLLSLYSNYRFVEGVSEEEHEAAKELLGE